MATSIGATQTTVEERSATPEVAKKSVSREQEQDQVWKRTLANLLNYQTGGVLWYGVHSCCMSRVYSSGLTNRNSHFTLLRYATAIAASGWIGHVYSLILLLCSLVSAFMLTELLGKFPSVTSYGSLCNAVLSSQWSKRSLQRARSIMDTFVNLEMYLYVHTHDFSTFDERSLTFAFTSQIFVRNAGHSGRKLGSCSASACWMACSVDHSWSIAAHHFTPRFQGCSTAQHYWHHCHVRECGAIGICELCG